MRQLLTRANDLLSQASVKFTSTDTCEWSFDKNSSNDTELAGSAAVLFESMEYRNKAVNRLREARALLSDALYLGIANNWGKYDKKKFAGSFFINVTSAGHHQFGALRYSILSQKAR
jgi:hypothetical protein